MYNKQRRIMKNFYLVGDFKRVINAQKNGFSHYGLPVFTNKQKAELWVRKTWHWNKPADRPKIIKGARK